MSVVLGVGDRVDISKSRNGKWALSDGHHEVICGVIVEADVHCFNVKRDDTGAVERDVREHYRPA